MILIFLIHTVWSEANHYKIQHESKELDKVTTLLESFSNGGSEFEVKILFL